MWSIWKAWNSLIFKQVRLDPKAVVKLGHEMISQYRNANYSSGQRGVEDVEYGRLWRRPNGWRLNTNAAVFEIHGNKEEEQAYVKNSNGDLILVGAKRFTQDSSVTEAELGSLVWSLLVCNRENINVNQIELDCKQAVGWVKEKNYNGGMGHVVDDCIVLMQRLDYHSIVHCKREANMAAHAIAKSVKTLDEDQVVWKDLNEVPIQARRTIMIDGNFM
ncbi:Uncharacterized protein TCM_018624 [Theobroma cacao]|uniref:RNase H type-1 domain-containing protein n=1 Tax=Theobroma cacao TaxID=3641 RepID=A0A061EFT9_THECC|nr:Uncharacterized protein TCM_018624 [Theobroma cacao]